MGVIGGTLGYSILKQISPRTHVENGKREPGAELTAESINADDKAESLLGADIFAAARDKKVVDFGCGYGIQVIQLAQSGASEVIGIDIREEVLEVGRQLADKAGVSDRCKFYQHYDGKADVILSVDSFEHFEDPGQILAMMGEMLADDGEVIISFGPTWYHPRGGHSFSVFPWAHLVFTEKALIRWRADFQSDGATRFSEVSGGLNQMTIRRFEKIVRESPLRVASLKLIPINPLRIFHNPLTREFFTSVVQCRLTHRKN
ncbi:class I SAM-dependent methyltransferase [Rhodopirellula sp. JC639]|uniref:class I SAM-dependent methyltransferase n=1 Tax=Stieleria mannarensis TaxID=2755585 RepID=UPI001602B2A4|nr:class I SAM-dependent methyltransferase [Rhodopirellula sp. JC639]